MNRTRRLMIFAMIPAFLVSCKTLDKSFQLEAELCSFGIYPQSKVTDATLISDLNSAAGTLPTSINPQNWTAYDWYQENDNSEKIGWYIDVDSNGDGQNDYRGVYFTEYRPYRTSGESTKDNSYQDKNGYSKETTYWFKYEPIEWRILENKGGDRFVMSNKIIDSEQFSVNPSIEASVEESDESAPIVPVDKTDYQGNTASVLPNNYQYSDLRTFLNVDFYNTAFSAVEMDKVQTTSVDNSASSAGRAKNDNACADTQDKVFALSYKEAVNTSYGFQNSGLYDGSKWLKVTDYAAAMGCYKNGEGTCAGCGDWWLRSPRNDDNGDASIVIDLGRADFSNSVDITCFGVVPALHLN